MVFYHLQLGPLPRYGHFSGKKLTPIFVVDIASLMAERNFTLGLISKTIKFPYFYWPSFSQDIGPPGYFHSCPMYTYM